VTTSVRAKSHESQVPPKRSCPCRQPRLDEAAPLVDEAGCEGGVVDQNAHLDVAGLAPVGEVGGGHQSPGFVDDDAFGVEAALGLCDGCTRIEVNLWKRFPEELVPLEEAFNGVHKDRGLNASLDHGLLKRREYVLPVVESAAPLRMSRTIFWALSKAIARRRGCRGRY